MTTMASSNQQRDLRIDEIEHLAAQVFGSEEKARQWLSAPNLTLGASPASQLDSEAGRNEVRKILTAIASGGAV